MHSALEGILIKNSYLYLREGARALATARGARAPSSSGPRAQAVSPSRSRPATANDDEENERKTEREREPVESIKSTVSQADTGSYLRRSRGECLAPFVLSAGLIGPFPPPPSTPSFSHRFFFLFCSPNLTFFSRSSLLNPRSERDEASSSSRINARNEIPDAIRLYETLR